MNNTGFNYFSYFTSFFILITAGCQSSNNPRRTLTNFLDAIIKNDYEEAYSYFSFKDRYRKSLTEFVQEQKLSTTETDTVAISNYRRSYEISSLAIMTDSAKAIVKITIPEMMIKNFNLLFYEVSKKLKVDSLTTPQNKRFYIITLEGLFYLIKEPEGWRVYGNWEGQRKKAAEESRIRLEYIQKYLTIKNIKIREYQPAGKIYLTATIKNSGEKILKEVEILIVCLNSYNKPCHILSEHPVSEYSKPLKPKEGRKFELNLTTASSDWTKRVEFKIVNCEFAE